MRVAFLADFHTGSHTDDVARLERIIAEAATYKPDLVLYGGDYVNMMAFGGGRIPPAVIARILGTLEAPLGRVGVIGNHDRNYDPVEVTDALKANGITMLYDERTTVTHEGHAITIAGIPDARIEREAPRALLRGLTAAFDRPNPRSGLVRRRARRPASDACGAHPRRPDLPAADRRDPQCQPRADGVELWIDRGAGQTDVRHQRARL